MRRAVPLPQILSFLLAGVAFVLFIWWASLSQSLDQLEKRGQSDLALAADRLVKQLTRYRELIVVLADDAQFRNPALPRAQFQNVLRRAADLTGALDVMFLDSEQRVIASASQADRPDWADDQFVVRALTGGLGNFHSISERFQTRAFYFSAPIFSTEGPVVGTLVVVVDLERIEAEGRGAIPVVLFLDAQNVVISSNRSELVMMQRGEAQSDGTSHFEPGQLRSFVPYESYDIHGVRLLKVDAGPYVPSRALQVERPIAILGLHAEALVDARPAYATAGLQATVAAALLAFFGAVLYLTTERRRALAIANAELETRVAERTRDLSLSNSALRLEVSERKEAEQALKKAQAELVQAGKLAALGQMSAGISHELNQPLMAIRSFAENAERFLEMERRDMVQGNLAKISDLAGRAARIIKNLKAFARHENEPSMQVDLCETVRAAIEMTESHLERENVDVVTHLPPRPVWVDGGEVRLQQVLVNLITNAVDAMAGCPDRSIAVEVSDDPAPMVMVSDTGPGIEDPERIFEPFYSTKSVGDGEGTGLGLSISYGLVQSFGGDISGENAADGGAVFTVRLKPWSKEQAA